MNAFHRYDMAVYEKGGRQINFEVPTELELQAYRTSGSVPTGRLGASTGRVEPERQRVARLAKDRGATSHFRGVSWYCEFIRGSLVF